MTKCFSPQEKPGMGLKQIYKIKNSTFWQWLFFFVKYQLCKNGYMVQLCGNSYFNQDLEIIDLKGT